MSTEKETMQKLHDDAMSEYTALHGHINYLRKKLELEPLPPVTGENKQVQGLKADSFFGHTIGAAIEKYLKIVKEPKDYQEIASALESGGLVHNSKSLATTVNGVLFRYGNGGKIVVQLPTGKWGLRDWYPSLKGSKKNGDSTDELVEVDESEPEEEVPEKKPIKKV